MNLINNLLDFAKISTVRCSICGSTTGKSITCGTCNTKKASVMKELDERPLVGINLELQNKVGDPDDSVSSWASQSKPNPQNGQIDNPLSPLQGDDMFFTYIVPGAVFQSRDGNQFEILTPIENNRVRICNRWYPRRQAEVSLGDIRRSIVAIVEPVQLSFPDAPLNVNYDAQLVKVVD